MRFHIRLRLMVGILMLCLPLSAFSFSMPELLAGFISEKSTEAVQLQPRIQAWESLIAENKNENDWQKLNKVNQFFNQVNYVEDKVQWGVDDYWASPREFLTRNAGDCEDYSIAKYFTLKAMGVPVDRLRITYVITLPSQQAHMVLVYLEGHEKTPLVLDNMQQEIVAFKFRVDLEPIYSFNKNGLWLASRNAMQDQPIDAGTRQVAHWLTLSARMSDERVL